jgi:hypothetical protein
MFRSARVAVVALTVTAAMLVLPSVASAAPVDPSAQSSGSALPDPTDLVAQILSDLFGPGLCC